MKKYIYMLAAVGLAGSWQVATAADVTGKVTLKGTPPPETVIPFTDQCGVLEPTVKTSRRYVVGKDNGLKNVLVYISKGCEGKTYPVPTEPVVLDQDKCTYQPYLIAVMAGQKVAFKDSDAPPVIHNVHASPTTPGNEEFNIMQISQGNVVEKVFPKPEVTVKVACNVHQWMLAYVGVMSNPYFAITDDNGNFKISNLPPGEYTLTAFHQKANADTPGVSQTIKVATETALTANFTIEVPAATP